MTSAHRDSTGTGLLFQQEAKTSGRIAEELVELIIQETAELEFLKHLTATSGRRPDLLAHFIESGSVSFLQDMHLRRGC
jgi:hypothetical protein